VLQQQRFNAEAKDQLERERQIHRDECAQVKKLWVAARGTADELRAKLGAKLAEFQGLHQTTVDLKQMVETNQRALEQRLTDAARREEALKRSYTLTIQQLTEANATLVKENRAAKEDSSATKRKLEVAVATATNKLRRVAAQYLPDSRGGAPARSKRHRAPPTFFKPQ
jgi:hypothetical protein